MMVINHLDPEYRKQTISKPRSRHNGAFYYSQEICSRIIPNVQTDRNWLTIKAGEKCMDHCIVFIHNNLHPERYEYLRKYKDLILVCGIPETVPKMEQYGTAIYLPLSIDVEYVKQYRCEDQSGVAFVGRMAKRRIGDIPPGTECIGGLPRPELLRRMAKKEKVYAVGRVALEAKVLGCEVLPYDPRFPDVERWKVMDNIEAAYILQKKLDMIDGKDKR